MCDLQTLATEGSRRPAPKDGAGANGAMRIWPILEVPAAASELREPPACQGRCDRKESCMAQQEGVNG